MGAILGIHHLCVQTPDMEASLHFYRDVLGFTITDRETCDFGEYAMLHLHGTRLELIEPNQANDDSFGAKGALAHFGLAVTGIDEVVESLQQKGVRFTSQIPETYTFPLGGFRAISLHGPSGEAINLYEFPADR